MERTTAVRFARTMPRVLCQAAVLALLALGTAGCAASRNEGSSEGLLVPENTAADASTSSTSPPEATTTTPTTSDLDQRLDEIDGLLDDLDEGLAENAETD